MRFNLCITFFFLFISILSVFSQEVVIYEGTIKDVNTKKPIPFATIAMYKDTLLVDGTSTNDYGQFRLETKKDFTHFRVSFIGYKTDTILSSTIQDTQSIHLYLTVDDTQLEQVVVEAERTTSELKIDRKIINIGADLQQSGATALEAFEQISEIQTDLGTGTISLRGSGNARLLINGKPSPLNTTELLDQIQASSIKTVEIITAPSAKNQADGLSGIINIILKKNRNRGLNLALNSSLGTKRYQYGFDANYAISLVNIRLNASQGIRNMDSKQWIYQRYTNGNTRDFFAPHDFNGKVSRISSGIDVFINDKSEVSFQVDYTNDFHSFYNNTFYTNVTERRDFVYTRNSSHTHKTLVYNTNYRKRFKNEGHFLELDYNLNKNENNLPATDFEEGVFLFDELQRNKNDLHALALDYALPIKTLLIETGASWNYRKLKSFKDFEPNTGITTNDSFNYEEHLIGMYGVTKLKTGKLNWQLGARYEYFTSKSNTTVNRQVTDLKFSNLFPSIHLSYKPSNRNTFSVGYSKRISRPNFHHINPFQIGNQYFQWDANPNLKPEFADNFELKHQYDGDRFNTSLSTFYHYRSDVIQWIEQIDSNGVRTVSFDNVGQRNSYGIESNINYKIANYWNTQLSANYYYTKANQPNITWNNLYSSNIILKQTFKLAKNIRTDITYRHTPKNQNIYSITQPRNRIDWAIRAKFLNKKLTANLRVVDIFDNNLRQRIMVLPNITQNETWRFQSQTFGWLLTINYKLFQNKGKIRSRKQRDYEHGGATD